MRCSCVAHSNARVWHTALAVHGIPAVHGILLCLCVVIKLPVAGTHQACHLPCVLSHSDASCCVLWGRCFTCASRVCYGEGASVVCYGGGASIVCYGVFTCALVCVLWGGMFYRYVMLRVGSFRGLCLTCVLSTCDASCCHRREREDPMEGERRGSPVRQHQCQCGLELVCLLCASYVYVWS